MDAITGIINTVAGGGTGDNFLRRPQGVAADNAGNVFISMEIPLERRRQ